MVVGDCGPTVDRKSSRFAGEVLLLWLSYRELGETRILGIRNLLLEASSLQSERPMSE